MNSIWFDFDGTLIDVSERYFRVHEAICRHLSIVCFSKERYWQLLCEGTPTLEILKKADAAPHYQTYIESRNGMIEAPEYLAMDTLRKYALETLNRMKNKGMNVFLITGRDHTDNLHHQIETLGIAPLFEKVYTIPHFGTWEDKYRILHKHCDASTPSYLIGDTARDIQAGQKAGYRTVALLGGMTTPSRLRALKPDYLVSELDELTGICLQP
ncbi:MAG TPA: HAD family hydrolase [Bacteroidia bacterium]|jgi:phosphoglycolate phosphatase-like HAD superfamily hydrolase|nr:HAD family hydrolase [Bacteroidia bacterium]